MQKHFQKILLIMTTALTILVPFSAFSAEDDLYDFLWLDQDKKVYVLQNKTYTKAKTFHFNVGYLIGLSGEFQDTKGYQINTGYYFSEEWGLELLYNSYNNSSNKALNALNQVATSMPFIRRFNSSYGVLAKWDPFYGKINTFNKIIYFNWGFGMGLAKIDAESNALTAEDENKDEYAKESYVGALLKSDIKVNLNEKWNIGLQYQHYIYSAPGPLVNGQQNDSIYQSSDFVLSVGFSF